MQALQGRQHLREGGMQRGNRPRQVDTADVNPLQDVASPSRLKRPRARAWRGLLRWFTTTGQIPLLWIFLLIVAAYHQWNFTHLSAPSGLASGFGALFKECEYRGPSRSTKLAMNFTDGEVAPEKRYVDALVCKGFCNQVPPSPPLPPQSSTPATLLPCHPFPLPRSYLFSSPHSPPSHLTLAFDTCRLQLAALADSVAVAFLLNATLVLPRFYTGYDYHSLDGINPGRANYDMQALLSVPASRFFDTDALTEALKPHIEVVEHLPWWLEVRPFPSPADITAS